MTITAANSETLEACFTVRQIIVPDGLVLSLSQKVAISRVLAASFKVNANAPMFLELRAKAIEYKSSLAGLGLSDAQLHTAKFNRAMLLFWLLLRLTQLLVCVTIMLPQLVMFVPVGMIVRRIAMRKAAEAVKASSVKVKGLDVVATWKLLAGAVLVPLFHILYLLVFCVVAGLAFPKIEFPQGATIYWPISAGWFE